MKKAKLNYTRNGYSYIKCTAQDCLDWGGMAMCDNCNEKMSKDKEIYLVFVLSRVLCEECFEEWEKRSKKYESDLILQKDRQLNWYRRYGFNVED